jgi:hypothetical protein
MGEGVPDAAATAGQPLGKVGMSILGGTMDWKGVRQAAFWHRSAAVALLETQSQLL